MMRVLEGRAEALAGTFKAQNVANTLWAASVLSVLCSPAEGSRWVQTVAQRLVILCKPACFNAADLRQLHQFFVWCSVEPRLGVEAINDMQSLKETCLSAFVGALAALSATQQQVSETLRHMGLSVKDEDRCPKSGYSIDMVVCRHALVSVPYWEWNECRGAGEREQYLRSKLGACGPSAVGLRSLGRG